ncbi:MAG: ATP-binding protein [Bacteroidales bacterium]|nr:ATP-binding protein [Bacteroidales bacterium]
MLNGIKKLPYGVSDFVSVRERNLYYVDKTMYLPELEDQPDTLIYIRPRRFGKSLFISMMEAYYDKRMADRFDELFGDLWIGSHPTPIRNRYQVLHLDFSQIGGTTAQLEEKFNLYCRRELDFFLDRYADEYPERFKREFYASQDASDKLNLLTSQAKILRIPLYLIIDEYDNFTNVVLNEEGEAVYHAITHADGFYRYIFKKFKGNFERIFLTGVSPVTLDDLTSGFNIGWNISISPLFDKMLGFSTADVRGMLDYYREAGVLRPDCDTEAVIEEMKPWYDNYCFAAECLADDNRVFNSDMVLYYLTHYLRNGESPQRMMDPNTKTDYNKLRKLLQFDKLDGDRKGLLRRIIDDGQILGTVAESFPAIEMVKPEMFASLLFYYGMLTIQGIRGIQLVLGIPNNNVRVQYYNYLLENYRPYIDISESRFKELFNDMAFRGEWRPVLVYMAEAYGNLSSVRDQIEGERNIQGFFMAYLSLNDYYLVAPELEMKHGYCDFFLLPNLTHYQAAHSYILELKYLAKGAPAEEADRQWDEAVEQVKGYAAAPRVEALRQGTRLHRIVVQFRGWKAERMEEV